MDRIEKVILRNLVYNEEYLRKVLPFIEPDYFNERNERVVFEHITKYAAEYNSLITKEVLQIEIEDRRDITQDEAKNIYGTINELEDIECDFEWLSDTTEKWCRDRAIYLALMESIKIADGQDDKQNRDAIPTILSDALSVSFNRNVGHDYLEDYEERYELYNKKESRIQFDLEYFNKITKGGLPNKTLNIALAGTGVGKSLFMCHHASAVLLEGKNVLYITLEMSEEKIAERIDANLLNVNIQEITDLPKPIFEGKVTNLAKKTQGSLIIKEYPTASAHSGHFKALLNELALKKSFKPDIIFIDYLNICASSRYRAGSNVNSYSYIKAIAEELRGLAVEASDVDLTDTSESFGLPATADLMFALISTEELEALGQIMVKQLKNRYNDPTYNRRFVIGVDRTKMRLYDCEQQAQDDLLDSGQEVEYNDEGNKVTKKFAEFKF
jgi:replicative DNA helicase